MNSTQQMYDQLWDRVDQLEQQLAKTQKREQRLKEVVESLSEQLRYNGGSKLRQILSELYGDSNESN